MIKLDKEKKIFLGTRSFDYRINKNKKFAEVLKKIINIIWIDDPVLSSEINNDVNSRYLKDKKSLELLSIQEFLDNINSNYIKNRKDTFKKFKDLKNDVKSEDLKDIVKEIEFSIFGHDDESKEESSGSGLKILTNKQMLSRLPTLLAQIQAGNNSKSLKNEIRQILYSLYRSKLLTKTVYNNLIKVIRA